MKSFLSSVGCFVYFAMGVVQIAAAIAGFEAWWGWSRFFSTIGAVLVGYFPILGTVMGIMGAIKGWNWSPSLAILIFGGPSILYLSAILIGGAADLLEKTKRVLKNLFHNHRAIKEAEDTLSYFSHRFNDSLFDTVIRKKIEEIIYRDFKDFTSAFDPIEGKAKEWVISQIINISGDLLETGQYCVWRGVLSTGGELLWKFYSAGLDEILKLNVKDEEGNAIDEEWIKEQKRILRKRISEVG